MSVKRNGENRNYPIGKRIDIVLEFDIMVDFRNDFVNDYINRVKRILDDMLNSNLNDSVNQIVNVLLDARKENKMVYIMGNGGSASTASHFVGDLSKGTIVEGYPRFRVMALTDNIPNMLAWGNDSCYADIFVEQLKNLLNPGDIVIGISGSGNSENVLRAIEYANNNGAVTIGWSGFGGGKLKNLAQISLIIPSNYMQRIEDIHLLLEHLITSLIREEQMQS
jgi:D-sedoheptulose 7-phosphate isomerase